MWVNNSSDNLKHSTNYKEENNMPEELEELRQENARLNSRIEVLEKEKTEILERVDKLEETKVEEKITILGGCEYDY